MKLEVDHVEVYPGMSDADLLKHFKGEVDCLNVWANMKNFEKGDITSVGYQVSIVYCLYKDIEQRKMIKAHRGKKQ